MTMYLVYAPDDNSYHEVPIAIFTSRDAAERAVSDGLGFSFDELPVDPEYEVPLGDYKAWEVRLCSNPMPRNVDSLCQEIHPHYRLSDGVLRMGVSLIPDKVGDFLGWTTWRCLATSAEEAMEKCRKEAGL